MMASEKVILTFLEHVGSSKQDKAKDLIDSVRKEIKKLAKMDISEGGKQAIETLKKMITNIESNNFKLAKKDYRKVQNGFNKYIKKKLEEVKDVVQLPETVGKNIPLSERKHKASVGYATKTKERTFDGTENNNHRGDSSSRSSGTVDPPRSKSRNAKGATPQRSISSRKRDRTSDSAAYSVPDKTDLRCEMSVDDKKSQRGQPKQDIERQRESNSVFAESMYANDPSRAKTLFESLHDNEWVDAFGVLQKLDTLSESEIFHLLLEIVQMAFEHCQKDADSQIEEIVKQMCSVVAFGEQKQSVVRGSSSGDVDLIKQYRLQLAGYALDNLISNFMPLCQERVRIDPRALRKDDFVKYIKKCVAVTWLMCVQDPPTSLHPTDRVIPSLYKQPPSNHAVDYIIWPALLYREKVLALGEVMYKRMR